MLFKSKKVSAPGCVSAGFYVCVSYGKNFYLVSKNATGGEGDVIQEKKGVGTGMC